MSAQVHCQRYPSPPPRPRCLSSTRFQPPPFTTIPGILTRYIRFLLAFLRRNNDEHAVNSIFFFPLLFFFTRLSQLIIEKVGRGTEGLSFFARLDKRDVILFYLYFFPSPCRAPSSSFRSESRFLNNIFIKSGSFVWNFIHKRACVFLVFKYADTIGAIFEQDFNRYR